MEKVAVVMLNYNMPEIIEHNLDVLRESEVPVDIIVVENGSDDEFMFTPREDDDIHMVYLDYNLRATHGYRMGLSYVKSLEALNDQKYFAYFIMTTTGQLIEGTDPIKPLYNYLKEDENAVMIQAAHDESSIGFWQHLRNRGTNAPRRTWMMEHSCALFRADWFDSADWLDSRLHIHGTDLYYSWQARRDGRGIYVHDGIEMHRHNNNMFELGRAPESNPAERTQLARTSMEKALFDELGNDWEQRLLREFVEEDWL